MIKGNIIDLLPATLKDRENVYTWCFHSETTKSHSGPPLFPDIAIPTYGEFCDSYYEEYFFNDSKPKDGRGFLIAYQREAVGFISYSSFHLKPAVSELDIWMNSEANCGKGFGTDAIISLGNFLHEKMAISEIIIAPSVKNIRAIASYKKAGFRESSRPMVDYLKEEYISLYGNGDYGVEDTALLVKQLSL